MEELIEREILRAISTMGEKGLLRDACEYALTTGGKRLRPRLSLMVAESLGHGLNATPAALSVEFFHTASLIADDLPCMDNDALRRGYPSLHVKFGEDIAILASYTLIAAGYEGIFRNGELMRSDPRFSSRSDATSVLCLQTVSQCAGLKGATQGQFLDLHPPDFTLKTILNVMNHKTSTLFEVAFVFGWLFGGGKPEWLPLVKRASRHLGMAFQISDDLMDVDQDGENLNIVTCCGKEKARELFEEEMTRLSDALQELHLQSEPFKKLILWLHQRARAQQKALQQA